MVRGRFLKCVFARMNSTPEPFLDCSRDVDLYVYKLSGERAKLLFLKQVGLSFSGLCARGNEVKFCTLPVLYIHRAAESESAFNKDVYR